AGTAAHAGDLPRAVGSRRVRRASALPLLAQVSALLPWLGAAALQPWAEASPLPPWPRAVVIPPAAGPDASPPGARVVAPRVAVSADSRSEEAARRARARSGSHRTGDVAPTRPPSPPAWARGRFAGRAR